MSYVNFNRALTKAQIEALGEAGTAVNGKIYFATDDGIYVGNADGSVSLKANAGGDITSEPLGPIDDPTNAYYTKTQTDTLLSGKQPTLVSGTNIKTINNNSLLGSGNITIDPNNTFIARYNVTSFADVKAAYLAGKTVVCLYLNSSSDEGDIYLPLYEYYTDDGPGEERFAFTGINYTTSYWVYLNENDDSWYGDNIFLASQGDVDNKVPYYNTTTKSVKLYGGYPSGFGSLTLYGGRANANGSLTMGYAYNNTNTTNNSIQTNGTGSFAGGYSAQNSGIVASGQGSMAFGYNNRVSTKIQATGDGATAIGVTTIIIDGVTYMGKLSATGPGAHAEGCASQAAGSASHTEGIRTSTDVNALAAHAEGYLSGANSNYSHAEGNHTVTTNESEHAEGKYNQSNTNTISSIGIGTADNDRKNAFEVMSTGDMYIKGVGTYDGTNPVSGTNDVKSIIDSKAPLASPALTGTPTAPTATAGTNTTQIATTAFVQSAISGGTANFVPYADTNNNSVTIGTRTSTIAQRSLTVGYNNVASSTDTLAIGYTTQATGQGAFAGGYTTISNGIQATGVGSFAFGNNTKSGKQIKASGVGSIAFGGVSDASDGNSILASGKYTVAIGNGSQATANYSMAIGRSCVASAQNSVAIGNEAHATGIGSFSLRGYSEGQYSVSIGGRAIGDRSLTIGDGTRTTRTSAVAMGAYNRYDSNMQFAIGVGSADNARVNAIEVTGDKFYVKGIGTYDGTNPTSGTNDVGSVIDSKSTIVCPTVTVNADDSGGIWVAGYSSFPWESMLDGCVPYVIVQFESGFNDQFNDGFTTKPIIIALDNGDTSVLHPSTPAKHFYYSGDFYRSRLSVYYTIVLEFFIAYPYSEYVSVKSIDRSVESKIDSINNNLAGKESTSNKVTVISSSSSNTQYPSAKCVYDKISAIERELQPLNIIVHAVKSGGVVTDFTVTESTGQTPRMGMDAIVTLDTSNIDSTEQVSVGSWDVYEDNYTCGPYYLKMIKAGFLQYMDDSDSIGAGVMGFDSNGNPNKCNGPIFHYWDDGENDWTGGGYVMYNTSDNTWFFWYP